MSKTLLVSGHTVYPHIGEFARRSAETRSGFLQRLAEREIVADNARRRKEFEALLGPPLHLGGGTVRKIKEGREDGKPWR